MELPPSAAVAAAVKFRDPEGHPLELLQIPSSGAKRKLGAGCSASTIPLSVFLTSPGAAASMKRWVCHLATPHLELLGYRHPSGRPAGQVEANDIAGARIVWAADRDQLLRDPDGHLHLLGREVGAP